MSAASEEQVARAIDSIPGWSRDTVEARPLVGGLLNSNWLAETGGKTFFMKVYGVGSENFVNRQGNLPEAQRCNRGCGVV